MSIASIPIAVIADAIGQKVTVELGNGDEYSGTLQHVDPRTLNLRLDRVLFQAKAGDIETMANVTVAGGRVKLVVLPDLMRFAPFFEDVCSGKSAFLAGAADAGKRRSAQDKRKAAKKEVLS
jgi:small nuclear ribonucleoprotein (snRNP)-like protein